MFRNFQSTLTSVRRPNVPLRDNCPWGVKCYYVSQNVSRASVKFREDFEKISHLTVEMHQNIN